MGTIGSVRAVFEADARNFEAATKSASASLGEVGQQAEAAGRKVDAATRLQEAAARRVQRVLAQVAAEQKALSGQEVTEGARKVAEATQAQTNAYSELRRVQGLVRSGYVEQTTATDLLAAAQSRAAETSAVLAEAKQREAAAAELASVREALASQKVTEEALRTTAALRAQSEAQSLLSRAQALVSGGVVAGPEGTQLVAAAQLKAVSASAEVATAKRAEAIAVARAAEEEALSQNVIIRAFQRVALVARESLDSIKERLSLVVEGGGIEAEGISRAFAGLGSALGAGIALTFVTDYLDGLAKINVELDHLATKLGGIGKEGKAAFDINKLAGLQQIVKEMGVEWEPVETGLVRMQKAQVNATHNAKSLSNEQVLAFKDIGISVQQLAKMNPEQLFVRVGSALAHQKNQAVATASAMTIFGRSGAALIPIFKEQGDQLEANMEKTGKLTGITDESAKAARRWTEDVARLSMEFRSNLMPVMELAPDVARGVAGAFMAAFSLVDSVLETAAAGVLSVVEGIGGLSKALYDISSGNYLAAAGDVTGIKDHIVKNFHDAFSDIGREWKKTYALFTEKIPTPPSMPGGGETDLSGLEGEANANAAQKAASAQMKEFEHEADVLEERGNADAIVIRAFWAKKMQAMQKGSAEYNAAAGNLNQDAIFHRLAEATKRMDEELQKSLHPKKDESGAAFAREQERAADESARRVTEIRQRAADEQAKLAERGQLSDVSIALTHGEISKYQALVAEAQIHAASFDAEIRDVQRRLQEAEALSSLPGMKEEIAKLQAQLAQLKAQAEEQRRQDESAIYSQTPGGALSDAMHQWAQQATDAAEQIRRAFEEAANGINDTLAKALTDPARTGYERMQNLRNGLAGVGRNLANQGIEYSLAKIESTLPGGLGKIFGGGKKPTGAKGDPLYVAFDHAAPMPGAGGGIASIVTGGASTAASAAGIDLGPLAPILAGIGGPPVVNPPAGAQPQQQGFLGTVMSKVGGFVGGFLDMGGSAAGKPDGTPSDPFSVRDVSASGGGVGGGLGGLGGGLLSGLFGGGGSDAAAGGGAGDMLGGLLTGFVPGFATGGPIAPDMGAFIVGERGPEILNIGSASGHVTPNSELRSYGGDTHHHTWNVDARGSNDPAAVEAAVNRAMQRAIPVAAQMGARMVHENRMRRPTSSH